MLPFPFPLFLINTISCQAESCFCKWFLTGWVRVSGNMNESCVSTAAGWQLLTILHTLCSALSPSGMLINRRGKWKRRPSILRWLGSRFSRITPFTETLQHYILLSKTQYLPPSHIQSRLPGNNVYDSWIIIFSLCFSFTVTLNCF